MAKLVVLVDTNVLIAAMLGSRTARNVLRTIARAPWSWVISPALIEELTEVPLRPKFEGVMTPSLLRDMLRGVRDHARLIHPRTTVQICRDPRDNHVLAAALDGHARYLITGDRDLLALSPFRGVAIVTPAGFLAHLNA